jgi:hypothetical protein
MRLMKCVLSSVVVLAMAMANPVSASSIAIANASFENPAADIVENSLGPFYGWNVVSAGGGGGVYVMMRPLPLSSPAVAENQVGGAAFDGLKDLACYCPTSELDIRQTLGTKYEANKTYTLSMHVGQYSIGQYRGYEMGLATANDGGYVAGVCDNTALHSGGVWTAGTTPAAGAWTQVTAQFTTGATGGPIGQDIMVRLGTAGLDGYRTAFDLVTLDVQSVPEPGTLALMVSASLGLICYAWRKRK